MNEKARRAPSCGHKALAKPTRFDTHPEAKARQGRLKAKCELMGKKIDKVKITRRGPKKTTRGEYFEVVPYTKIMPKKSLQELGETEGEAADAEATTSA